MSRQYKHHYKKHRSDPAGEVLGMAVFIVVIAIWQWQQHNSGAFLYIWLGIIVLLGVIAGWAVWQYFQKQRQLRALDIAGIDSMDPLDFERYVAALLKSRGFYDIALTEKFDYGVDIIARKDNITWGIQVKRYSNMVKAEAVRQVIPALIHYKCDRAMVVTNSTFSRTAQKLAAENNCVLINRDELSRWIVQFQDSIKMSDSHSL